MLWWLPLYSELLLPFPQARIVVRNMNGVMVDNAKVVTADIGATNGIVHIIDHVLVPPDFPEVVYPMNIVELAESQPDLATLVTAVVAGKLATTLASKGPFTVFAPTNEAILPSIHGMFLRQVVKPPFLT